MSHPSAPDSEDMVWLAALAEALRTAPAPRTAELALLDALEEIEQWRRHARPDTWQRTDARRALSAEFAASDARLERHLRPALSPWLAQYTRVLHGTFTKPKVGAIDVAAMDAPAAALRAALGSARGIGAAWQDAVEASRSGHDEHLAWSLANLTSQLAASGRGSHFTRVGAASVLHPGRWSQPEHPRAAAHEILTRTPAKHHCAAWITYARARLMGNEETFGPVTFFEADFVLPNALADDGHPFPHRDELRRLARGHPNGWQFDDVNCPGPQPTTVPGSGPRRPRPTRNPPRPGDGTSRLSEMTGIDLQEMHFVGDRPDEVGNDYPVKAPGVPCHAVTDWEDTARYLEALIPELTAGSLV